MVAKYNTKDNFLNAVSSQFEKQGSQAEVRSALLDGISLAEDDLRIESINEKSQAFHLKLGAWVIRDSDIPIFEAFNSTAAAVTLSLTTAGIAWPAVTTALTAFANICWRIWRKGAHLSSRQMEVYGFLKAHGPMLLAALADTLQKAGKNLTEDDVAAVLESLAEIELNDGSIITLASKDHNGYWKPLKI
jgi:hypothetical protein